VRGSIFAIVMACSTIARADDHCGDPPQLDPALAPRLKFEPGRTRLEDEAKPALQPLVDVLHAHPRTHLAITGHLAAEAGANTDVAAKRRAEVIKWYLVDHGVEAARIVTRVSTITLHDRVIELELEADPTCPPDDPAAIADVIATKLHFEPGFVRLDLAARTALQPVVDTLQSHPRLRIVVVGHLAADARSKTEATAKRRAEAVKWYLVDQGVETERIATRVSAVVKDPAVELEIATGAPPRAAPKGRGADLDAMIAKERKQPAPKIGSGNDQLPRVATPKRDELTVQQPTTVRPPAPREDPVTHRTTYKPMFDDRPVPVSDAIGRRIQTLYMQQLSRCYRNALRDNPGLSGKVSLTFTVDESGSVLDAKADGVDDDLDSCLTGRMGYWHFMMSDDAHRYTMSLVLAQ